MTNRLASPKKKASDIMPIRARSVCAVTAKYAGRIGKVHGDKKLKNPATNASRVKTRIPESGRLGLGANGLNGVDVLVPAFGNKVLSIELFVVEELVG